MLLKTLIDNAKEPCLLGKVVKKYQRTNFGLTIGKLVRSSRIIAELKMKHGVWQNKF